jgi:hypothetical protein
MFPLVHLDNFPGRLVHWKERASFYSLTKNQRVTSVNWLHNLNFFNFKRGEGLPIVTIANKVSDRMFQLQSVRRSELCMTKITSKADENIQPARVPAPCASSRCSTRLFLKVAFLLPSTTRNLLEKCFVSFLFLYNY